MTNLDEFTNNELVPGWVREVVTVGLAICAILLYGGILVAAIYRTLASELPLITFGMERAAAVLGGLIGTVVTAGFARSRHSFSVQAHGLRPVGAKRPSVWKRLDAGARVEAKMLGLARTVGLRVVSSSITGLAADQGGAPASAERNNKLAMWLAIVYFVVYFIVGFGAFGLTIMRDVVPDMVSNAGWVWLGTMVSAGYAFFSVNPE